MLPQEFAEFFSVDCAAFGLERLDHRGRLCEDAEKFADRSGLYFIAPAGSGVELEAGIQPGREGWLTLTFPTPTVDTLFKAQLGAKSEWKDPATEIGHDNRSVIDLFAQVSRRLRRRLQFGVLLRGASSSRLEKSIGYSPGAEAWANSGKCLRQLGVVYSFHPPKTPGALGSEE